MDIRNVTVKDSGWRMSQSKLTELLQELPVAILGEIDKSKKYMGRKKISLTAYCGLGKIIYIRPEEGHKGGLVRSHAREVEFYALQQALVVRYKGQKYDINLK